MSNFCGAGVSFVYIVRIQSKQTYLETMKFRSKKLAAMPVRCPGLGSWELSALTSANHEDNSRKPGAYQ